MGDCIILHTDQKTALKDGKYIVEFSDIMKKRSDRQNAMLWSIVNKISKKINGNIADSYDIYCQLLEMSGAEYTDIMIAEDALPKFKELVKHIKIISKELGYAYCRVFKGISEMNEKQANELIETALKYAGECDVDVDTNYIKSLLKEGN